MQCRYRWYCKWVLNRVPRHEGPALDAGKLIHETFEDHARTGTPMQQAAYAAAYVYQAQNGLGEKADHCVKVLKTINDLYDAWPLWHDIYPMDVPVLEAEEPFEITFPEMPGVIFRGRPDRVCIMAGQVWHVQSGLAANANFSTTPAGKRHTTNTCEHLARSTRLTVSTAHCSTSFAS
jgi:hypothetical protein